MNINQKIKQFELEVEKWFDIHKTISVEIDSEKRIEESDRYTELCKCRDQYNYCIGYLDALHYILHNGLDVFDPETTISGS